MPHPEPSSDDFRSLPSADDDSFSKEDLWRIAKEKREAAVQAKQEAAAREKAALWEAGKQRKAKITHYGPAEPVLEQPEPEPAAEPTFEEALVEQKEEPENEVHSEQLVEEVGGAIQQQEDEGIDDLGTNVEDQKAASEEEKEEENEDGGEVKRLGGPPPEESTEPKSVKERLMIFWAQWGGKSLMFSIGLHLALLLVAAFVIVTTIQEPTVDFLAGGGTQQAAKASDDLKNTVQRKRTQWNRTIPLRRLTVDSDSSLLKLPDNAMDIPMPDVSSMMDGMFGGFGRGTSGSGNGFGSGFGKGGQAGFLTMFGKTLKGTRLAVVLDVSGSMLSDLPTVVKEVDRVARGSAVVCFAGCGLGNVAPGEKVVDRVMSTGSPAFDSYWRELHGPANGSDAIGAVFRMLRSRRNTYFVAQNPTKYAWLALQSDEVALADTLYWFSDFLDEVDPGRMRMVLSSMRSRKQKLYVQPLVIGRTTPRPFQMVCQDLVFPTGGEIVEPGAEQKPAK
ncbi:MAG: hypothetical protein JNJ83_08485 [Verrucomicrobiaceae bacterium]|nr:hypothetical protein [Verrucomicrobiaceae bacterium]